MPLVRSAHVWPRPAAMAVKVPPGGVAFPATMTPLPRSCSLLPQQVAVPLVRSAHVWESPAVMAVKVPSGGVACPTNSPSQSLLPQQVAVASVRSAHV